MSAGFASPLAFWLGGAGGFSISGVVTFAEGYYAKHAKMLRKAGTHNLALYTNLDNDTTDEDETVLQEAMDEADRYVDTRARVLRLMADSGATSPHMIATDGIYFERISDLASAIAVAEVYRARGFTGDANNQAEGQMADMDKRAKAELDQILDAVRIDQALAVGSDGMAVLTRSCNPCEYRGPLSGWRRW